MFNRKPEKQSSKATPHGGKKFLDRYDVLRKYASFHNLEIQNLKSREGFVEDENYTRHCQAYTALSLAIRIIASCDTKGIEDEMKLLYKPFNPEFPDVVKSFPNPEHSESSEDCAYESRYGHYVSTVDEECE